MKREDKNPEVKSKSLQTCDIPREEFKIEPFTMLIFGGGGDLSRRKLLPAVFHLYRKGELAQGFSLLGFGRRAMNDQEYRNSVKEGIKEFAGESFPESKWNEFARHLFYLTGLFEKDGDYGKICQRIAEISVFNGKKGRNVIHYLAVPPNLTPLIVEKLRNHDLCKGRFNTKVIIEKPFGRDRPSAAKLNSILRESFEEIQIYRIDHYLGKETVQNIIFFRFSNSIFEPLWNRRYIDHIQITVAESLGIEHRGTFYEQAGAVRDIVQNHIMQLIGLVAMEPPVGFEADFIRNEKVKIFQSIRVMDEEYIDKFMIRGQYGPGKIAGKDVPGYREEENVSPRSNTPTFLAGKLHIDNWRWAGVPFYIRTGKCMPKRISEICIQFKQPPLRLFGRTCDILEPNVLVLSIQPQEKISLRFGVKYPYSNNQIYPVNMEFGYEDTFKVTSPSPYERLLVDCMKGDLTLFVRQDGVEAMWAAVDPLIAHWEKNPPKGFPNYSAGSWGPREAEELIKDDGRRWQVC